ncbi:MAG TPA: hypothetical protein VJN18_35630 [Polyangiaceae bacterium]|nr:hypothetical protein [Polyangiaceae bacterium]
MTRDEIAKLRELGKAATPGPWIDTRPDALADYRPIRCVAFGIPEGSHRDWDGADIAFIAATRNALPALLDAAERLARLESALEFLAKDSELFDLWREEDGVHAETPHGLHGVTAADATTALLHHCRRRGWHEGTDTDGE